MNTKTIAENRVVRHEYFIIESYEAGIELSIATADTPCAL